MRNFFEKLDLQLFADGASGGDGAGAGASAGVSAADAGQPTGVNAADAGQNIQHRTLEDLGVPKDKAEKYRARKGSKAAPGTATEAAAAAPLADNAAVQEEAAAPQAAAAEAAAAPGITWDDVVKNPAFNQKMQEVISARVKPIQAKLDSLSPALEVLGKKYGIDTSDISRLDVKALSDAVTGDSAYYEDAAAELGVDLETAKTIKNLESRAKRSEAQARQSLQEAMMRQHFEKLQTEAEALKRELPSFDLKAEMQNPQFVRMTSPEGGLTVAQAFHALHYREIEQAKAQQAAKDAARALSNAIQSGRQMPRENGATGKAASSVAPKLYSQMNPAERAEYKRRLQMGR